MIEFKNICKSYKSTAVLYQINFSIQDGETVCLIGESGSGKTTLLKMINRLITPTSGEILINGKNIADENVLQLRRNIGYVIQQTGLFPHMTIRENIELIPRAMKKDPAAIAKRTVALLEMVGLAPERYMDRYPSELSGGQQQRVGVARAFACDPDIILMDEPFSALDPITRSALQDEVAQWQTELKKTIVFVTHDMDEAVKLGDRICILNKGRIEQYDTPENIMKQPGSDFVAQFIGKNRIWSSPELIMTEDIMVQDVQTCSRDLSAFRALEKMRSHHINGLMVVDFKTNRLVGVVSAQALRRLDNLRLPVSKAMETDFLSVHPRQNLVETLNIIMANHLSYIPVVDERGALCGLITQSSLVTSLSKQYVDVQEAES